MRTRPLSRGPRRGQAGVVLFVALIVLVSMSLAGIAIMRSVGSGVMVASNLAFKQTTTAGAERGVEAAKTWLVAQSGSKLDNSDLGNGYHSKWGNFDPLTYDWSKDTVSLAADTAGTAVRYIVHRLCLVDNMSVNAPTQQCVMKSVSTEKCIGCSLGGTSYGVSNLKSKVSPYYRVTVRSDGPKSTVSYVQVVLD